MGDKAERGEAAPGNADGRMGVWNEEAGAGGGGGRSEGRIIEMWMQRICQSL